jgi:chromosome partitioning protein
MSGRSAHVLTVTNQKGGVGKTTTVVNLAATFARLKKRVLVVDLDYQGNATDALGARGEVSETGKSAAQAIRSRRSFDDFRCASNTPGVEVVGGTRDLRAIATERLGRVDQHRLVVLLLDTPAVREYDLVLVDTHGAMDALVMSALAASHSYLVPLFAESHSLSGLQTVLGDAEELRRHLNPGLSLAGCLITSYDRRIRTHERFAEGLRGAGREAGFRVFGTVIPASSWVKSAEEALRPVVGFAPEASAIVQSWRGLSRELLPHLKSSRRGRAAAPNLEALGKAVGEIEESVELA